jgi:hypothetical protein
MYKGKKKHGIQYEAYFFENIYLFFIEKRKHKAHISGINEVYRHTQKDNERIL